MIRLPVTVTNLPPQPYVPSAELGLIDNIRHWWTTHQEEYRTDPSGRGYIRPVIGSVPLQVGGTLPATFSEMTRNGRTRNPFVNDRQRERYFSVPIEITGEWLSVVTGFRAEPGNNTLHLCGLWLNEGTLIIRPIISGNAAAGGGISWHDGTTETVILSGPRPTSDETHFLTLAWNRATGRVKYAIDDATPVVSGTTAAVSSSGTANLTFGANPGLDAFVGHALNLGIIDGDALTEPLTRQRLSQYRIALYGA
uniref:hypothetical protein n=1 Tax=Paracoccus sp. TRP TaxID=412597 RepID=UPI000225FCD9|nr:hypothetical protein [Paracoccus sp. TRP]